jgi:hypothetical protein
MRDQSRCLSTISEDTLVQLSTSPPPGPNNIKKITQEEGPFPKQWPKPRGFNTITNTSYGGQRHKPRITPRSPDLLATIRVVVRSCDLLAMNRVIVRSCDLLATIRVVVRSPGLLAMIRVVVRFSVKLKSRPLGICGLWAVLGRRNPCPNILGHFQCMR